MPHRNMPEFFINAFYESKFRDALFIVKAGGKIIEDDAARHNLIEDIRDLTLHGIKVLLIYGGGRALDVASQAHGIEVRKHEGRRITDKPAMELMKQVVGGSLALSLYETMAQKNLDGITCNAVPHDWMDVKLRPKTPVDFGYVGDIHAVHARPIHRLFKTVDFIATPCLAYASDGGVCNINGDTIATELAIGTKASKLVFLSDVDGVKINDETAFVITAEEIPALIANGTVYGGMQVKLENCKRAVESGVKRIHLINGLKDHALKKEIYEPVGPGTMMKTESERESYMNEVEAQKLIEKRKAK